MFAEYMAEAGAWEAGLGLFFRILAISKSYECRWILIVKKHVMRYNTDKTRNNDIVMEGQG